MTKEALKKGADDIFRTSKYPKLYATEDANYFENISDANAHNTKYVKGEIHTFIRNDDEAGNSGKNSGATKDAKEASKLTLPDAKDKAAKEPVTKKTITPAKTTPVNKTSNKKNKGGKK